MTQKQKQKIKNSLNGNKKDKKTKNFESRLKFANKILFLLILLSSAYFVASINDLSIKGFVLEDLKKQAAKIEDDNRALELSIMELKSYDNLIARVEKLNMVKVNKIDYITVINGRVAKK